jgi:hypothetical protein
MPEPIRVYLDTCVVSGLARGDLRPSTVGALLRILEAQKAGHVQLLTSSVTREEIERIPESYRTPHQTIYTQLAEIPTAVTHGTDSGRM